MFKRDRMSFRLVGLLILAYLLAGSAAFYLAKDHMSGRRTSCALNTLYFCVVTMTTIGYGDIVLSSDAAKLLASAFTFAGIALIGTFLSKSADYLVEKQESLLFCVVHGGTVDEKHSAQAARLRAMEEANRTRYKLYTSGMLLAACVVSGMVFLWKVEGMRPVDAFYCACSTVTTLGYGDRSFLSLAGRAFAVVWVTVSTVEMALFFLHVVELYAERRQRMLARWVLTQRTTSTDLEPADMDGDRRVDAMDYYKEDALELTEEFERLYDLTVSQPMA